MSIHHEVVLQAGPERIYELLTNGAEFEAATGAPADLEDREGAEFTLFGGHIRGRNLELAPSQRVVQAWRGHDWDTGAYSVVRFTLAPEGGGTRLQMDQTGYPDGPSPRYATWREHLHTNWPRYYFEPFARHLAGQMAAAAR